MQNALRTEKTFNKFKKFRADGFMADGCGLCEKVKYIKEFRHWRIVNNLFPYDRIAKINHILIPKRHIVYKKLNKLERKELELIKSGYIEKKYQLILQATQKRMSVPDHFHLHLIVLKK